MEFLELQKRYEASHVEQERIRKAIDRRWVIDGDYPGAGPGGVLEIFFYVSSWGSRDDGYPRIPPRIGTGCSHSETVDRLSARALRRVAAVKQLYEDWFDGKISEIPVDLPAEIANLP